MPFLSSCNIACGGHAGNEASMETAITLAQKHGVKVGAHPSYPDRENFGRKAMDISEEDLKASLKQQLLQFKEIAQGQKALVHHVKAHGALYNQSAKDPALAHLVCGVVHDVFPKAKLYVPYQSAIDKVAREQQITVVYEAFADRNYRRDGSLVPRSEPGALIENPATVCKHVKRMYEEGKVLSIEGEWRAMKGETFCVHGDHPQVLAILKGLAKAFSIPKK